MYAPCLNNAREHINVVKIHRSMTHAHILIIRQEIFQELFSEDDKAGKYFEQPSQRKIWRQANTIFCSMLNHIAGQVMIKAINSAHAVVVNLGWFTSILCFC